MSSSSGIMCSSVDIDEMDELNDAAALISGVLGSVITFPSGYVLRVSPAAVGLSVSVSALSDAALAPGESPGRRLRITTRTACPDAKAPRTPITPAASSRPPDSRFERT